MSLAILSPGRLCIQYLPASDTEDSPHPREFHLDFSLPNDKSNVEQIGDNLWQIFWEPKCLNMDIIRVMTKCLSNEPF